MNSWFFRPSAALALFGALGVTAGDGQAAAVDPTGDLDHVRPLLDQTLETEKSGIEIRWSNPETGHSGKIRVERTFFRNDRPCRDYLRTVSRPDRSGFVIRGTACRTGRAVWTIGDEVAVETDQPPRQQAAAPAASSSTTPKARAARARPPEGPQAEAEAKARPGLDADDPATAGTAAGPEAAPADEPFVSFTLPSRSPI